MADMATKLDSAYSVPGRNFVGEISGLLSLPKPTIATISNYLIRKDLTVVNNNLSSEIEKVYIEV